MVNQSSIWMTSDWHFGHGREFIWKARGFQSIEEMNNTIVTNHNSVVAPEDDVYVLGDLMLGDSEKGIEWVKKLNGKLHIIRGNHDTDRRWKMYQNLLPNVVECQNAIYLKYNGYHFYLSHYPSLTGNLEKEALKQMTLNLYGHTHQMSNFYEDRPYMYHVGVDSHACYPCRLDDIIGEMKDKMRECQLFLEEEELEEEELGIPRPYEAYQTREEYRLGKCDKCIHFRIDCGGPSLVAPQTCPAAYNYKRDPPDGGYYG